MRELYHLKQNKTTEKQKNYSVLVLLRGTYSVLNGTYIKKCHDFIIKIIITSRNVPYYSIKIHKISIKVIDTWNIMEYNRKM